MPSWLSRLEDNFLSSQANSVRLQHELRNLGREVCRGELESHYWLAPYTQQRLLLKEAYRGLLMLERELVPEHPANSPSEKTRALILGLRSELEEAKKRVSRRQLSVFESCLDRFDKGLAALEARSSEVLAAAESVCCPACLWWNPAGLNLCQKCERELPTEDELVDFLELAEPLPQDYAELRALLDEEVLDPARIALKCLELRAMLEASLSALGADAVSGKKKLDAAFQALERLSGGFEVENSWLLLVSSLSDYEDFLEQLED